MNEIRLHTFHCPNTKIIRGYTDTSEKIVSSYWYLVPYSRYTININEFFIQNNMYIRKWVSYEEYSQLGGTNSYYTLPYFIERNQPSRQYPVYASNDPLFTNQSIHLSDEIVKYLIDNSIEYIYFHYENGSTIPFKYEYIKFGKKIIRPFI